MIFFISNKFCIAPEYNVLLLQENIPVEEKQNLVHVIFDVIEASLRICDSFKYEI